MLQEKDWCDEKQREDSSSMEGRVFFFSFSHLIFLGGETQNTGNRKSSPSAAFFFFFSVRATPKGQGTADKQAGTHTHFLSGRKCRAKRGRELISEVEVL